MNSEFKNWYSDNSDLPPNALAVNGFNQVYAFTKAVEAVGSTEYADVVGQLEGMSYESPMGNLSFRKEDHQTKLNFVAIQVQDGNRTVLEEYPELIGPVNCNVSG